ncbi:MAG: Ldh family oxidoreductase [Gemmatimonadetes bacterium]|nr:Ldh family oxidoreductase [Gemmatimonadota bacterium]
MRRFDPEVVRRLVRQIAEAAGVLAVDAQVLADSLVDADLHGASTHGVSRLNIYVRRIQEGVIDPRAKLRVEHIKPAVLRADARSGLGQVQAMKVLHRLYPLARELGAASATIRNSQHFGALAYYCNQAAARDMVLLATTNAEPAMPPHGGSEAFFGTNPVAASFPTGKGYPIRIDLATSLVARGNIIAAAKKGESIPPGWAIDAAGEPTTDAAAALAGAVLPMAGHKGYALALMVETLSGVLSGAAIGRSVGSMYKDMDRKQNVGHFFCLLDIAAHMEVSRFKERIDAMIDEIKRSRRRPGVEEILVPGELEHRTAIRNRREGIPIDEPTLGELETLCGEYGVSGLAG